MGRSGLVGEELVEDLLGGGGGGLGLIAGETGGDDVAFGGGAAAGHGDDVVHGELVGREVFVAVVAFAFGGELGLPPGRGAEGAGAFAFAADVGIVGGGVPGHVRVPRRRGGGCRGSGGGARGIARGPCG